MIEDAGGATTSVNEGFEWHGGSAGRILLAQSLDPLATHVFTTKELSFRGETAHVDIRRLAAALSVEDSGIVTLRQVHGRTVMTLRPGEPVTPDTPADAVVCADPARAVAVFIADCVPVLIADRQHRVVAAVHAGWRGTAAGVVAATVEAIGKLGVAAADLVAAIGPSIGPCCYQVDRPVRDAFVARHDASSRWFSEDGTEHWRLDLWQANADQLVEAGIHTASISVARLCTSHDRTHFHSYRRDGAGTGRLAAAIRLRRRAGGPAPAEGSR